MWNNPVGGTARQENALQCLRKWIDALEGRIISLLSSNDIEAIKAAERERAATRYISLLLRMLQLQQQFAVDDLSGAEQGLRDAFFGKPEGEGK